VIRGHYWGPEEIVVFVNSVLKQGDPLAKLSPMKTAEGKATASFTAKVPVLKGHLNYTTDVGSWQNRKWQTVEAKIVEDSVAAKLPRQRPLVYYLDVVDRRGAMVSTEHAELP